jgi:hypothetical protein
MKLRMSTLIFVMLSGTALAQGPTDEGMTQISDGLYAKITADGESYVALSPAGHQALLVRLIELRDDRTTHRAKPGTGVIGGLIATLSQPQRNVQDTGDCNGRNPNGPLSVKALAGGGVGGGDFGASSIAQNNDGFSPPLNSTNFASAETIDRNGNVTHQQATTTHGPGSAIASAFVIGAAGCDADSSATVTCPGHTQPSISAFATAHKQSCIRN